MPQSEPSCKVLPSIFRRLMPGVDRGRSKCKAPDVQAPPSRPRVVAQEGVHGMYPPGGMPVMAQQWEGNDGQVDSQQYFMSTLNPQEQYTFQQEQAMAIEKICRARSTKEMQTVMDWEIRDDWLGGLDAYPGNIYLIFALSGGCARTCKGFVKRFGFVVVFLIQLLGPPFICWQYLTGDGVEKFETMQWSAWSWENSFTDWTDESNYYITKIIAFLFVLVFCLNGLFCHLDETNAWLKIDRLFNILMVNGEMEDASMAWMYIGSFMNSWVIIFLCVDVFFVLGTSESVLAVLMDAMGLAFLYNLDDVAGDLGFVDNDDWPGLQFAWMDRNIDMAIEAQGLDDSDPDMLCQCFLYSVAAVLVLFCFCLPILFCIVPFKAVLPDPYFQSIEEDALKKMVQEVVRNVTGVGEL